MADPEWKRKRKQGTSEGTVPPMRVQPRSLWCTRLCPIFWGLGWWGHCLPTAPLQRAPQNTKRASATTGAGGNVRLMEREPAPGGGSGFAVPPAIRLVEKKKIKKNEFDSLENSFSSSLLAWQQNHPLAGRAVGPLKYHQAAPLTSACCSPAAAARVGSGRGAGAGDSTGGDGGTPSPGWDGGDLIKGFFSIKFS